MVASVAAAEVAAEVAAAGPGETGLPLLRSTRSGTRTHSGLSFMLMFRVFLVLAMFSLALPAAGSEEGDGPVAGASTPIYTGVQFQALYRYAVANTLPGLDLPGGAQPVTGNAQVDQRIWDLAVARGYVPQPVASGELGRAGILMQPLAASGWSTLNAEARDNRMGFIARSAYRSLTTQRIMFNERLTGTSDAAIERALTWAAPPGMSKHHSGYAIDFRYPDGTYGSFRASPGYAWLAADNFDVAKRHGFLPSYPDDVTNQGPNPEPWEFVWVGTDLIECGLPQQVDLRVGGPAAALAAELATCPGGAQPVAAPSWLRQ